MRDALRDVRDLLESAGRPLTTNEVVEGLGGAHERAAVEHLIRHFEHEHLVEPAGGGSWTWVARDGS